MDDDDILDRQYWDGILTDLDRKDDNSARRYRRYNKSVDAMGEKTVLEERNQQFSDDGYKAFEALMSFVDTIENERLLRTLKSLKPNELQIITWRFKRKMQVSEIAKELNKGVSTISERLERILNKIRSDIK